VKLKTWRSGTAELNVCESVWAVRLWGHEGYEGYEGHGYECGADHDQLNLHVNAIKGPSARESGSAGESAGERARERVHANDQLRGALRKHRFPAQSSPPQIARSCALTQALPLKRDRAQF